MLIKIHIDINSNKKEAYKELIPQIESLIDPALPLISNLSNITAALKQSFPLFSWTGFYFLKNSKLFLGPFQGNVACTMIDLGKGVCGKAASEKRTIVVDNVNEFPGHIFCDEGSRSEIVVPVIKNDILYGVLDIDSYEFSSFDETDKLYLEEIISIIAGKLEFHNIPV